MAEYSSESIYITASESDVERLNRIDAIIVALENRALLSADKMDMEEYHLNDGQITIRTTYRSVDAIAKAIDSFMKIRARIASRITGTRILTLRDARELNGRYGY